jgi:hypothetical protein
MRITMNKARGDAKQYKGCSFFAEASSFSQIGALSLGTVVIEFSSNFSDRAMNADRAATQGAWGSDSAIAVLKSSIASKIAKPATPRFDLAWLVVGRSL